MTMTQWIMVMVTIITFAILFASSTIAVTLRGPHDQPKFTVALPRLPRMQPNGTRSDGSLFYHVPFTEMAIDCGVTMDDGTPVLTTMWVFSRTYPGPTFHVKENERMHVLWDSQLPPDNHIIRHDRHDNMGDDAMMNVNDPGVRNVVHVHGAHVLPASDGHPLAWFTPNWTQTGVKWEQREYTYTNDQPAMTLWYHDHAAGVTRLNVYAGMAGMYLVHDDNEALLQSTFVSLSCFPFIVDNACYCGGDVMVIIEEGKIPSGEYEVEMLLQDRNFDSFGQLWWPSSTLGEPAGGRDSLPQIYGSDGNLRTYGQWILVNGKVWPYFAVKPTKYRLRFANACDARFFLLTIPCTHTTLCPDGLLPWTMIGTDGGFMDKPV
jgi:spore coat protein A